MDTLLLTNIGVMYQARRKAPHWIAGNEMAILPELRNAWLLIEGDCIIDFGEMQQNMPQAHSTYDCGGASLFPAWCDSHTHIVYAGSRELEFVDKIKGLSYEEIAQKGGGILNSAAKLAQTSEDELFQQAIRKMREALTARVVTPDGDIDAKGLREIVRIYELLDKRQHGDFVQNLNIQQAN
jgi:imidazolonepropionase